MTAMELSDMSFWFALASIGFGAVLACVLAMVLDVGPNWRC